MRRFSLLLTLLAACYEPEAVDCTIECAGADECTDGQQCGSDGYCAAPEIAGSCRAMLSDDPQSVTLMVTISGHGKVTIDKVGTCDSESPSQGTCMFAVLANVMQKLKAVENNDREFVSWTSTCSGSSSTCTVTPVTSLTQVGARFE
jgi:hypothetical protein